MAKKPAPKKPRKPAAKKKPATKKAAPKKKAGRPRVLTDEKKTQVLAFISAGGSRVRAAAYVGVGCTVLADEQQRDPIFSESLTQAEANCEMIHLGKVNQADDWRASAWFLARKFPAQWAEVKKLAETDAKGQDLTPEERERAIMATIKRKFGDRAAFLEATKAT